MLWNVIGRYCQDAVGVLRGVGVLQAVLVVELVVCGGYCEMLLVIVVPLLRVVNVGWLGVAGAPAVCCFVVRRCRRGAMLRPRSGRVVSLWIGIVCAPPAPSPMQVQRRYRVAIWATSGRWTR